MVDVTVSIGTRSSCRRKWQRVMEVVKDLRMNDGWYWYLTSREYLG